MRTKNKSYKGEIEATLPLELTVKGDFHPDLGTSALRVFFGDLEITDRLSKAELQSLGSDFEESMRDEGEHRGH